MSGVMCRMPFLKVDLLFAAVHEAEESRGKQNCVFEVPSYLVMTGLSNQTLLLWLESQTNRGHALLNVIADHFDSLFLSDSECTLVRAQVDT